MEKKRQANFQRTKFYAYAKLGLKQKSKRKYRRATGRHNKIRQKWRSKTPMVEIGYKNENKTRGLINEKIPVLVYNAKDLARAGKENIVILGNIGDKKKIEIAKEARTKGIEVYNLNINKFLKEIERRNKMKNKNAKTNKTEEKKQEESKEAKK
jgi:ribosomal protein L32E